MGIRTKKESHFLHIHTSALNMWALRLINSIALFLWIFHYVKVWNTLQKSWSIRKMLYNDSLHKGLYDFLSFLLILLLLCYENNISYGRPEKNEWICFGWKTLRWKAANGILGSVVFILLEFFHCTKGTPWILKQLIIYMEGSTI